MRKQEGLAQPALWSPKPTGIFPQVNAASYAPLSMDFGALNSPFLYKLSPNQAANTSFTLFPPHPSNQVDHFQKDAIVLPVLAQILHKHQPKSKGPIQYILNFLQCTLDPQITRKCLWMLLHRQQGSHWLAMNFPLSNWGQIWASDPEGRGVTSHGLLPAHSDPSLHFIKLICL